jgi:hypothetical protein
MLRAGDWITVVPCCPPVAVNEDKELRRWSAMRVIWPPSPAAALALRMLRSMTIVWGSMKMLPPEPAPRYLEARARSWALEKELKSSLAALAAALPEPVRTRLSEMRMPCGAMRRTPPARAEAEEWTRLPDSMWIHEVA